MSETRKRILERRAKFVAAAITAAGAGSCEQKPIACLSPVPTTETRDAGAPDGTSASSENGASGSSTVETADVGPEPMPCLKVAPASEDAGPKPLPCLSPMPTKK